MVKHLNPNPSFIGSVYRGCSQMTTRCRGGRSSKTPRSYKKLGDQTKVIEQSWNDLTTDNEFIIFKIHQLGTITSLDSEFNRFQEINENFTEPNY